MFPLNEYLINIPENQFYDLFYLKYVENLSVLLLPFLKCILVLLIVTFITPFILYFLILLLALFSLAYKYFYRLGENYEDDAWQGARKVILTFWFISGRLWHGYEVVGLENILNIKDSGALLVGYHGAIPIDFYYLNATFFLKTKKIIRFVTDNFLYKIPVLVILLKMLHIFPGSFQACVQRLKKGELVMVAPGGVLEAQFGDENYLLLWDKRIGFAKAALEAKVPIIPIFTQNLREAFRTIKTGRNWFMKLYEKLKYPLIPIYGGLPVKLRIIVGSSISYDPSLTPEELAKKTAETLRVMIKEHQRIPGNTFKALLDRVYEVPKSKIT